MKGRKFLSLVLLTFFGGGALFPSSPLAAEKAASLYKDLCTSCHGVRGMDRRLRH